MNWREFNKPGYYLIFRQDIPLSMKSKLLLCEDEDTAYNLAEGDMTVKFLGLEEIERILPVYQFAICILGSDKIRYHTTISSGVARIRDD